MGRSNSLWFSFKGTTSAAMGLRVTRLPDVQIAEARGKSVEIPGRDGDLWLPDHSYKSVILRIEFEIGSGNSVDVNAVNAWLTGYGNLVLSSFPAHYWKGRVIRGFDLVSGVYLSGNYRTTVEFRCEPCRYMLNEPVKTLTEVEVFTGDGTTTARPIITVYGSGNINLMVNRASVLLVGVDGYITLDCDAMMAFKGEENKSPSVTIMSEDDGWPTLVPGVNEINWSVTAEDTGSTDAEVQTSEVTSVVVQPNWRWR